MGDCQGHSHRWRSWIWAINLLFIACTVYASAKWPHGRHLQYFNLGLERTLGTWWSAMQLLFFGLLAHSIALEAESARARRAWFLLAVTGMALFADETASIHEHLWVARWGLAPIAAVFLIALVYSIHMLRSEEERYGNAWRWLVLGFALFALVYPLEVAEDQFRFPLLWQRALRTGVEEGVELAGMFALLAAAATARQGIGQPTPWLPRPSSLRLAIGLGAVLAPPVLILRGRIAASDYFTGGMSDFGIVIPTLLFACAGWLALRWSRDDPGHRRGLVLLAVVLLLLSVDAESPLHRPFLRYTSRRFDVDLLLGIPLLILCSFFVPRLRRPLVLGGLAALLAANFYSVATPFSAPVSLMVCYLTSLAAAAGVLHFASREAALVAGQPTTATPFDMEQASG
jgi:hypothetical protein